MAPQKSASGLLRNASGGLMESRMGSISRDATASRKKLIDEGLQSLLGNLMKDLTVSILPPTSPQCCVAMMLMWTIKVELCRAPSAGRLKILEGHTDALSCRG